MTGKRGTGRAQSRDGAIDDSGINHVYFALRDAVRVEQASLPSIDGPTTILPRSKTVSGGTALPHSEDVRAVLRRALATLDIQRSGRPELRYLRLALRRHLELGLNLNQAFGYSKAGKGAPPLEQDRARRIACAVFEQRFIDGRNAETAGHQAVKEYGVSKTQALAAFAAHAGHALMFHKVKRLKSKRNPLWTQDEIRRLDKYYKPLQARVKALLDSPPGK